MESVDGEVDGIHAGELVADLDVLGLLNSGLGAQCSGLWGRDTIIQYTNSTFLGVHIMMRC
jgi:hypothetical protein